MTKWTTYHHMIHYILGEMVKVQNSNETVWNFYDPIIKKKQMFQLKFCLLFIVGDTNMGNEKLCDCYGFTIKEKNERWCGDYECSTGDNKYEYK